MPILIKMDEKERKESILANKIRSFCRRKPVDVALLILSLILIVVTVTATTHYNALQIKSTCEAMSFGNDKAFDLAVRCGDGGKYCNQSVKEEHRAKLFLLVFNNPHNYCD